MTDLNKLIEAVEAGTILRHDLDAFIPWRGLDSATNDSLDAYNGSLDAAKRLHDALLPGWRWVVSDRYGSVMDHDGSDDLRDLKHFTSHADDPARAWLIAILKAIKTKGEAS